MHRSSSDESAMPQSHADKKSADKNGSCDVNYRLTKVGQLLSADNIGQFCRSCVIGLGSRIYGISNRSNNVALDNANPRTMW